MSPIWSPSYATDNPFGHCPPRKPYCSLEAQATYWRGPFLSSSLLLLIEPGHFGIERTDPIHFSKPAHTSAAATTTFWSEDLQRLHDAISEKDWKILVGDWKELHCVCCQLQEAYPSKVRERFGIFKVDIFESVSVRLEIQQEYQTFIGEYRPDGDQM